MKDGKDISDNKDDSKMSKGNAVCVISFFCH